MTSEERTKAGIDDKHFQAALAAKGGARRALTSEALIHCVSCVIAMLERRSQNTAQRFLPGAFSAGERNQSWNSVILP